jgi:hypothetical protein
MNLVSRSFHEIGSRFTFDAYTYEALNWLEQNYRDRNGYELNLIRIDPFLAPLRGDPRFEALAGKIVPGREFKGGSKAQ